MSSQRLTTRLRENLASSDGKAKLVALLIAAVFSNSDLPLVVAVDEALTRHGYDFAEDADLGLEVALRIDAFIHSLGQNAADLIIEKARQDHHFASSIAQMIALSTPLESQTSIV